MNFFLINIIKFLVIFSSISILISCDKNISDEEKVNSLLEKMTLAEKVGQLNQFNGGWYSTGPISSDNEYNNKRVNGLRNGSVGSMLNVTSVEATKEAQRIAVEESRLGIPLLFAYDVIHGFQTMFPIPRPRNLSVPKSIEIEAELFF